MSVITALQRELWKNRKRDPKAIIVNYDTYYKIMKDVDVRTTVHFDSCGHGTKLWGIPVEVSELDEEDVVIEYARDKNEIHNNL